MVDRAAASRIEHRGFRWLTSAHLCINRLSTERKWLQEVLNDSQIRKQSRKRTWSARFRRERPISVLAADDARVIVATTAYQRCMRSYKWNTWCWSAER